jgi:hypothetical protein
MDPTFVRIDIQTLQNWIHTYTAKLSTHSVYTNFKKIMSCFLTVGIHEQSRMSVHVFSASLSCGF